MITISLINDIVTKIVDQSDLFIVEITVMPGNKMVVLVDSMKGVSIDECSLLSRAIEQHLNREVEDFELEVSSPGLNKPFKVPQQYHKNTGREVDVVLKSGQKISGKLVSVGNNDFAIEVQKKIKPEGKKRPQVITEKLSFTFNEVKATSIVINF
jgi:ribosome maturation factor RimP